MPSACLPRKRSDRGSSDCLLLCISMNISPLRGLYTLLVAKFGKLSHNKWRFSVTVHYPYYPPHPNNAAKGSASNDSKPEFTFVRLPPPSCKATSCGGAREEITAGIRLIASVRLSSFAALIFCLLFHQGKSKRIE